MQEKRMKIKLTDYLKNKWDFCLLYTLLLFSSMNYFYIDSGLIFTQTIEFWDAVFSGHIFSYNNGYYNIFMMILISIWEFPIYIIKLVSGINVLENFFCQVYYKLGILLLVIWSAHILKLISKELKFSEKNQKRIEFMYCSSVFVFIAACLTGQTDIYGLFFTLLAILYLMRGRMKMFFLFFILAVQCKYFPFFLLVPIILLIEKNILKILAYIVSPFIVGFLFDLPLRSGEGLGNAQLNTALTLKNLAAGFTIPLSDIEISLPLIIFIAVCIWAYLKNTPENNIGYWYIYLPLLSTTAIFLTERNDPYRLIYLAPFITLIVMSNLGNYFRKMTVEIVATICLTVGLMIECPYCFDFSAMHHMLMDRILPFKKFILYGTENLTSCLTSENLYGLWTLLIGVFVVWMIGLLYYNHPDKYTVYPIEDIDSKNAEEIKKIDKVLIIRMIAFFLITNHTTVSYAAAVLLEIGRKIVLILS